MTSEPGHQPSVPKRPLAFGGLGQIAQLAFGEPSIDRHRGEVVADDGHDVDGQEQLFAGLFLIDLGGSPGGDVVALQAGEDFGQKIIGEQIARADAPGGGLGQHIFAHVTTQHAGRCRG